MQGKIKRLEARDQKQARGMDTQAMIPVLAMVVELVLKMLFKPISGIREDGETELNL